MTRRWLPTNTASKLTLADTILADIVPTITDTRARILDMIPGHSGKPAGTGDPPGGQGGSTTSVVERISFKHSDERDALDNLDRYCTTIDAHTRSIAELAGARLPVPLTNAPVSHARRLAWDRWALRTISHLNPQLPNWITRDLLDHCAALESICADWQPATIKTRRTTDLAADDTETWCRSHLRIGSRVHRDPRYTTNGVCRWCGDFHAQQGFMPTLELLDHHESGRRITMQMVDAARPTRGPRKRK